MSLETNISPEHFQPAVHIGDTSLQAAGINRPDEVSVRNGFHNLTNPASEGRTTTMPYSIVEHYASTDHADQVPLIKAA